jgi:hypothetical protein
MYVDYVIFVYPLIVKCRYMKWRVMVFNATFSNISVMSWRRILWRKLEYPEKTTDQTWLFSVRVMVFNTTFNNISVMSWRSFLLVEETESTWRKS